MSTFFLSLFTLKGPPPDPLCVLLIVTGLFSTFNAQSVMTVKIHRMTSEKSNPLFITQLSFYVEKVLGAKKSIWMNQEGTNKAEIEAVCEACKERYSDPLQSLKWKHLTVLDSQERP